MEQPNTGILKALPSWLWIGKLAARCMSAVFCISAIGVGGSLATTIIGAIPFGCIALGVVVGLCWDIAEIVCILKLEGHKGIHPGACVGVDLVLWLEFFCGSIALGALGYISNVGLSKKNLDPAFVGSGVFGRQIFDDDTSIFGPNPPSDLPSGLPLDLTGGLNGLFDVYLAKTKALLAFGVLLWIIHLALFVVACIETHKRRAARRFIIVQQPVQPHNGYQMQAVQVEKAPMQQSVAPGHP